MHFWMELNGIKITRDIGRNGKRCVRGCAVNFKAGGDFGDMVAVAHPDLFAVLIIIEPAIQNRHVIRRRGHKCAAIFGGAMPAFDQATKHMHHDLLAVADAQNRDTSLKQAGGWTR